jgi:small GTP-binding protein
MIQKKICMLGSFAVGKTSLVARFVHSIYSDVYHTTVGVKIDKKTVNVDGETVMMMLWDLHGEDEFQKIRTTYLRGASGFLLVADGTRKATLDKALGLRQLAEEAAGAVPMLLVINKKDLSEDWEIEDTVVESLRESGWAVLLSSAKTGEGVEEAFHGLALRMLGR